MRGEAITRLRNKLGVNQTELATALGVAGPNVVSRWETGRRKPGELTVRVLRYLDDIPVHEARTVIRKLEEYGKHKQR